MTVKLLIVDDSGFMRIALRNMVKSDANIEIIGEAKNGKEALTFIKEKKPNVVTMDVEMPVMDGLSCVKEIMKTDPVPVIMVSSLTQSGAKTTMQALEYGAVDFISKSSSFVQLDIVKIEKELREKIHYWAKHPLKRVSIARTNRLNTATKTEPSKTLKRATPRLSFSSPKVEINKDIKKLTPIRGVEIVVIAVSTGGPKQLFDVLEVMEPLKCPMVIAQHMGSQFTKSFAEHLGTRVKLDVKEGKNGQEIGPGNIIVAPGSMNTSIKKSLSGKLTLHVSEEPPVVVKPSANILFGSVINTVKSSIGVILTGMGDDGTEGALKFIDKKWPVLVQKPETCVVGGMPGAAISAGAVSEVLELEAIGKQLKKWVGQSSI